MLAVDYRASVFIHLDFQPALEGFLVVVPYLTTNAFAFLKQFGYPARYSLERNIIWGEVGTHSEQHAYFLQINAYSSC